MKGYEIPKKMLRWHLYGAGFDNLKVEEADVPSYGENELLVRQDACGLCFSDTKVIGMGDTHPRLTGRDLKTNPVTLGHEVACTVVGVGKNIVSRFHIGDRFVIQADVFYHGVSMAYGYVLSGGLSQYSVIPKEMLQGDEGVYLLPVKPTTGYVESALTEPWACVVSAYEQHHRSGIKANGAVLIISTDQEHYDFTALFSEEHRPATLAYVGTNPAVLKPIQLFASTLNFKMEHVNSSAGDWRGLLDVHTGGKGFDDIIILGQPDPDLIETLATLLADHGILNLVHDAPISRKVSIDIGRIHYNWHHYIGTATRTIAESYRESRTSDLLPGGVVWYIGAGGPMGQMHVQLAVQHPRPPRRIVASDVDAVRLQSTLDRFSKVAAERHIELIDLNPKELGVEGMDVELRRLAGGSGFDDIVSLVPVPAIIEDAIRYLAPGGWFNIFAGVARGTMAKLDLNMVSLKRSRFIGSSGSSLNDMRQTLQKVENRELSTNSSLAAIGGMRAAREGIQAVKEGRFAGKALIFPHIPDVPLLSLTELKSAYPTVYAKLKDGQFWTKEAEEEFLRIAGNEHS